jgi:5-methylthioadenosine/S-adenosylhomocysteine deaminase
MARTTLIPDMVLDGVTFRPGWAVAIDGDRIAAVGPADQVAAARPDAPVTRLAGQALLPGGINGHNHSFQILLRGFGEDDDFFGWRSRVLYPLSERLSQDDIRRGAELAFADMLTHGVTTVADFFYLNDHGVDNALAVAEAARRVGIRLVLARCFYDWEGAPARYRETPAEARRHTEELFRALAGDPLVRVQVAPHSPHGASAAMIEVAEETAEQWGVPLHIHCAEGRYEREQCLAEHGATPVGWLDRLGALTARTVLIHAVWVDDADLDLMADRGARVIHNPSSNMILGDGVAPVPAMLDRGITVGLGTDGGCTNDRSSILDEMRMAALLQKVTAQDGRALDAERAWRMGTVGGADALEVEAGQIAPGRLADLVSVDLDDWSLLPGPPNVRQMVYALSHRAIRRVYVGGEERLRDGDLVHFDAVGLRKWARSRNTVMADG